MEGFTATLSLGKSGAAEAVVANNTATPAKKKPFMMYTPSLEAETANHSIAPLLRKGAAARSFGKRPEPLQSMSWSRVIATPAETHLDMPWLCQQIVLAHDRWIDDVGATVTVAGGNECRGHVVAE